MSATTLLIWETFATTILYDYWNKTDEYWRGFARGVCRVNTGHGAVNSAQVYYRKGDLESLYYRIGDLESLHSFHL